MGILAHAVADGRGNIFVSDPTNDRVLKYVISTSTVSVAIGLGAKGFSGDGASAEFARLDYPSGLAVDANGNLYIADTGNRRVRKVDSVTGIITTVAGNGAAQTSGDGGPAFNAGIRRPTAIALDGAGNFFISDSENQRIRRVDAATGVITTFAGTGIKGFSGDGGAATAARFANPTAMTLDAAGNLYVSDSLNHRIRRVGVDGVIQTVAGNGAKGAGGLGGSATLASLNAPTGLAVNAQGELLISDSNNHRVVRLSSGQLLAFAGTGIRDSSGDGGPASAATFRYPAGLSVLANGNVLIADGGNQRVRLVDVATGSMSSLLGNHISSIANAPFAADQLVAPTGVAVDSVGNIYVADPEAHAVRRIAAGTGVITTVAGMGSHGFSGGGGPANAALLSSPSAVAVDAAGDLYIADTGNQRIRKVVISSNLISTVAGDGVSGYFGDGGAATSASLAYPGSIALGPGGDLYIADTMNHRIRKVSASTGVIQTIAGTGVPGSAGVGGPAISAQLRKPVGLAVDASGNVFIGSKEDSAYVMRIDSTTGILTRHEFMAPGWGVSVPRPVSLAIGPDGSLYTLLAQAGRIYQTRPDLQTVHIAGFGRGYAGDDGDARQAQFNQPSGIAIDNNGNIYVADTLNRAIRKLAGGPPEPPTQITLSYLSQQITVSFLPGPNNGFPIIDYTATCGSQSITSGTSPIVFSNMPRGVNYACTLVARNSRGTGAAANFVAGSPVSPPAAPTGVSATSGIGEVLINATPPTDDGGGPITAYQVEAFGSGQTVTSATLPVRAAPPAIPGGVSFQFRVRAINQAGAGPYSQFSNSALAIVPPSSPILDAVIPGDRSLQVNSSGYANGGSLVIDVTVTCSSSSPPASFQATAAAFPVVVSGLTNGVAYTCAATARNIAGSSSASTPSAPATPVAPQFIDFPLPSIRSYAEFPYVVTASGGASGNPVILTSLTPSVCTSGGTHGATISAVVPGSCVIRASQAGSAAFAAAPDMIREMTITKIAQTIIFTPVPTLRVNSPPVQLTATGGASGLPVEFYAVNGTCTTSGPLGATLTPGSAGSCRIVAIQQGNQYYAQGYAEQWITVEALTSQVILFNALGDRALAASPIALNASGGTSGNPVIFTSLTPSVCSTTGTNGSTLSLLALGTCSVQANQAGSETHSPAAPVTRTFEVIAGLSQVISFAPLEDRVRSATPFVVSATGGASGNPVTFSSSTPATCTTGSTNGQQVSMVAEGVCTIVARQAAGGAYAAAADVSRSFTILPVIARGVITVDVVGAGGVTSSPVGIACPSTCSTNFPVGSPVTLTATPAAGMRFSRWSGGICSGSVPTCVLSPVSGPTTYASATFEAAPTVSPRFDFDGNGRSDIVLRNASTGQNYLYPMNGTAILPSEGAIRSVPAPWMVAGVGDFDGDGRADLLWRNTATGENYLYPMNGTTILSTEGYLRSVPTVWTVGGVADFDGDGKADILWRNTSTGENYLYFMDGKTIKSTEGFTRTVPTVWTPATVADFDGDGKADILWRNTATGENYLYFMDGRVIKPNEGFIRSVTTQWVVGGSGDFDGDGKADLLWRNTTNGENYLYFMDGRTIKATEGFIRSVATAWTAASVGDFDGDGKADILWRNTTTGENYIYPMDGRTIKPTEGFIRSGAPAWSVMTK